MTAIVSTRRGKFTPIGPVFYIVKTKRRRPALDTAIRKERRELTVCDSLHQQAAEPDPIDSIQQPTGSEPC